MVTSTTGKKYLEDMLATEPLAKTNRYGGQSNPSMPVRMWIKSPRKMRYEPMARRSSKWPTQGAMISQSIAKKQFLKFRSKSLPPRSCYIWFHTITVSRRWSDIRVGAKTSCIWVHGSTTSLACTKSEFLGSTWFNVSKEKTHRSRADIL